MNYDNNVLPNTQDTKSSEASHSRERGLDSPASSPESSVEIGTALPAELLALLDEVDARLSNWNTTGITAEPESLPLSHEELATILCELRARLVGTAPEVRERWVKDLANVISNAEPTVTGKSFIVSREGVELLVNVHQEIAKGLWGAAGSSGSAEWRDIETLPPDNKEKVLLYAPTWSRHPFIGARWGEEDGKYKWIIDGYTYTFSPTKWQPLPAPPADSTTPEIERNPFVGGGGETDDC